MMKMNIFPLKTHSLFKRNLLKNVELLEVKKKMALKVDALNNKLLHFNVHLSNINIGKVIEMWGIQQHIFENSTITSH